MPEELHDAAVQAYVARLAGRIASNSDLKAPLQVSVLNSPEIHAIALPGGFLFVSSGLIATAESESQLAGILAHEIARIAARHGARASKRSIISSVFVQVAHVASGLFTGGVSNVGALYGINYGFQGLGGLVDRALAGAKGKYQKEADQMGIQYAWKAGFDPKGFINFLDTAAKQERSKTAGFFRTHSNLDERMIDIFTELEFLPKTSNPVTDSLEFQQTRRLVKER